MLNPFDDAQLDTAACLEYLQGYYNFDLLPQIPQLIPFSLAACVLDISEATLEKLVSLEAIPTVQKPGDTPKIPKKDLIKYIQTAFLCNEPLPFPEISPNNSKKMPQIPPFSPK